jgi:hypothetical protein
MTSERRLAANRRNARASTGPKSAAGKARSAHNSRRHGLAIPIRNDPGFAAEIESLAKAIAGEQPAPGDLSLAREIAESQIEIVRVRRYRLQTMGSALPSQANPERTALQVAEHYKELEGMDRYERRALSRRKGAMTTFNRAQGNCDS